MSAALGACFAALAVDSACSSTASLVGAGGACELASECVEGLVCIPDPASSSGRSCSSDLSSIQVTEFPDTGTDAMEGDGSDDGSITTYPPGDDGGGTPPDATVPKDSGGTTPPQDSGSTPPKDSGTPPPPDSGPADAGGD